MMRMEPGLNVPNHLCLRAGIHAALGHLAGAPVNDFVPLRLGVRVHGVIKAGNELAGQIRPVLLRQGHYFGHSLGGNAPAAKISASRSVLAGAMVGGTSHLQSSAPLAERLLPRYSALDGLVIRLTRLECASPGTGRAGVLRWPTTDS